MTDDTEQRSLLDEINLTRIVSIALALTVLLTIGTGAALAADDPDEIDKNDSMFCNKEGPSGTSAPYDWTGTPTPIGSVVETFISLLFGIGLLGVFVVWQGSAIGNILSLDRNQKRRIKRYRGSATKSFAILVIIGPLFTILTNVLGMKAVDCIGTSLF